jgi:hypothetical protein
MTNHRPSDETVRLEEFREEICHLWEQGKSFKSIIASLNRPDGIETTYTKLRNRVKHWNPALMGRHREEGPSGLDGNIQEDEQLFSPAELSDEGIAPPRKRRRKSHLSTGVEGDSLTTTTTTTASRIGASEGISHGTMTQWWEAHSTRTPIPLYTPE